MSTRGREAWEIIGAGGIGCAVGYALARGGARVTFVERNPAKLEAGRRLGVQVSGLPALPARFQDFKDWSPAPDSRILLCLKCYDNRDVLARIPEDRRLISIQNGFDVELDARDEPVEAIASFVSECHPERPETRLTRFGSLHVGARGADRHCVGTDLQVLAATLHSQGLFKLRIVENVLPFKHSKLMYNAAISPLASAGGLDNGTLLRPGPARRLFFALLQENYRILRHAGKELGKVGPFSPATVQRILKQAWLAQSLAWAFYPSLKGRYCSMSLDLPAGKTEIDNYNGYLIGLAGDFPCPLNRLVLEMIQRMEAARTPPGEEHLTKLEQRYQTPPNDRTIAA
jgi:2-dehydropantoate 2-reductase